jgi:hypothetical protein
VEYAQKYSALEAFDIEPIAAAKKTIFGSGRQSWYLDAEGVPASWPWTQKRLRDEMASPNLDAFDLVKV